MLAIRGKSGAPSEIRTRDPRIRNPVLYPSELRGRTKENQWFFRCEVVSQVDLTAKLTATGAPPVLLPSQRSINFLRRFPHHVRHHVAVRVHREAYITVAENLHHSPWMGSLRQ